MRRSTRTAARACGRLRRTAGRGSRDRRHTADSGDGSIRIWDPATRKSVVSMVLGMGVSSLVDLPDSRVALASGEGVVVVDLTPSLSPSA